jgi:y4mF family transcriptional regulator
VCGEPPIDGIVTMKLRLNADVREDLAATVRHRRRALGLTQVDVADLAGVGVRLVHELERGDTGVRLDKLLAVLEVLGLVLDVRPGSPHA